MYRAFSMVAVAMLLFWLPFARSGEKKADKEEPMSALGSRFIKALANGNVKAATKCWKQWNQYEEFINNLPKEKRDLIPKEAIAKHKTYISERDAIVAKFLPRTMKQLKDKRIDLKSLRHVNTQGPNLKQRGGLKTVSSFTIVAKDKNGLYVRFRIDDGATHKGKWYFTDRPLQDAEILKKNPLRQ